MSKKVIQAATAVAALAVAAQEGQQDRNLYVQVTTHDNAGKVIGTRIVDMYHFGTRNWLHNHSWWAFHNGHSTTAEVAHPDDVAAYLAEGKNRLAEKFNTPHQVAIEEGVKAA